MRVNWYYRPRDVQRFNNDTRLVYATMHSDLCPLTSLRGKCIIKHRSEFQDLEAFRKEQDSFYFTQVFDRFIRRWYECIPTSLITNVPEKVKKALDERWKFVAVEVGRVKELTSAVKTCKRCGRYCASQDSVDCAICGCSYHMNCVQPPLPKKPSRGFAWACGPCSRATEQKKEARDTPTLGGDATDAEEEVVEEEEAPAASNESTRAPSPAGSAMEIDEHPATQAEVALAQMWPMRYLGIHCRVEDALQYDDRAIYPRASSRLGPRHQANVSLWPGRPVELVKPADIKKRFIKNGQKKDGKLSKETLAAIEADRIEKAKRPKWVQDEPPGYVARGEDYPNDDPRCTAKVIFKMPERPVQPEGEDKKGVDPAKLVKRYVKAAQPMSRRIGVPPFGVNFLDKSLELLCESNYDEDEALAKLAKVDRVQDLHEPVLSKSDLIKFEEGVAKYGSEHRLIRLHMKTHLSHADIVRFYYLWKKTPKGKEIWGNYPGRKGKKRAEDDAAAKLHEEVANDVDDSAYDNDKAARNKRAFQCKFCSTIQSRQWRRAPGAATGQTVLSDARTGNKDKKERLLVALCTRCANLWRKYAVQFEDYEEMQKKISASGGKALKRKYDEELHRQWAIAAEIAAATPEPTSGTDAVEPAKKRSKVEAAVSDATKKKPATPVRPPTPEPPPIVPAQPQWKVLPCAVCHTVGDTTSCGLCKLTVHRSCYGMPDVDNLLMNGAEEWTCDQCQNDRNPSVSTEYTCVLCLTEMTDVDLIEAQKMTHRKKSEREKEKERLEKELADAMRAEHNNKQIAMNRPLLPREPLKKTTGNNWVHVYCAVWTPEIRFSNAKALEVAEGFQLIPAARHEAVCKLCKNKDHQNKVRSDKGACVNCFQCQTPFHVSCAFEAGYQFGFDVTPVKGSRKDQITTATLGAESGNLTPGIWCKEHVVKTIIHPMHEIATDTGKTALQVYVENYKQADLTMTGTVRKAQLAQLTKDKGQQAAQISAAISRRDSTAHSIAAAVKRGARTSTVSETKLEETDGSARNSEQRDSEPPAEKRCVKCKIDVTPKWHAIERPPLPQFTTPVYAQRTSFDIQLGQNGGRFAPPGANGHQWEAGPVLNGQAHLTNGGSRSTEPMQLDGVPQSRERSTSRANGVTRSQDVDYLCHKCFVRKKLEPTPPPEPPARIERSPPRQHYPVRHEWNGPSSAPSAPSTVTQPGSLPRSPWEEATRSVQAQPPAPPQTGAVGDYGAPTRFAPQNERSLAQSFGPSFQPPNGFSNGAPGPPPPAAAPLGPPPSLHESRSANFSFHGQPPSNAPPFTHSRPPSLGASFLPSGPPIPNGAGSPHNTTQHAAMPSPTFPPPHHAFPLRRNESPFSTQLPALGQPAHSVAGSVSRPASAAGQAQPHQGSSIGAPPLHSHSLSGLSAAVPPSTPREPQDDSRATPVATPNASGASASPSLRNLLS